MFFNGIICKYKHNLKPQKIYIFKLKSVYILKKISLCKSKYFTFETLKFLNHRLFNLQISEILAFFKFSPQPCGKR